MRQKILIFGNTKFSYAIRHYMMLDSQYEVIGITVDDKFVKNEEIPFSVAVNKFNPLEVSFLVTIGYSEMNMLREKKYHEIKQLGYNCINYISTRSNCFISRDFLGENNIILPGVFIDYNVTIGNGNIFKPNSLISHDCILGNFNFIASSASVAGNVTIGSNCFLGLNSSIKNKINVGNKVLVGAGAYVNRDMVDNQVILPAKSIIIEKTSDKIII